MNLSCAFVFLFVVNIASGYTTCRDWPRWLQNKDDTRNIFGGTPIKADGDFPYLVSLRSNDMHICGGSILNERYILTAAHCVLEKNLPPHSIQYGTIKIDPRGQNVVPIKHVTVHENYLRSPLWNDIALIELEEDIKFGKYASPISLPYQNEDIPETDDMLLMGWGRTEHELSPLHGLYTNVSKFPDAYCIKQNPRVNLEYQYCGGIIEGGRAACNGDSGGPVVINGRQYGIVSGRNAECGTPERPEFYTRVPAYRIWINKHIGI